MARDQVIGVGGGAATLSTAGASGLTGVEFMSQTPTEGSQPARPVKRQIGMKPPGAWRGADRRRKNAALEDTGKFSKRPGADMVSSPRVSAAAPARRRAVSRASPGRSRATVALSQAVPRFEGKRRASQAERGRRI